MQAQEGTKSESNVKGKLINPADSVTSLLPVALEQAQDSLKRLSDTRSLQQKADSLQYLVSALDTLKLIQALDSLKKPELPMEVYQAKEDSIRRSLDYSSKLNQQIKSLQQEMNNPLQRGRDKLQHGKVTAKPDGMNEEFTGIIKEQTGLDLPASLPQAESLSPERTGISADALPEIKGLPMGNDNSLEVSELSLDNIELPEIKGIKSDGIIEKAGGAGGISESLDKAGEFSEDFNQLPAGKIDKVKDVDKLAEEQLMQREETAFFKEKASSAGQPAEEFLKYRNPDQLKEKVMEEAPKAAVDHFAGKMDQLKAAKEKLNKHKGRFQEVKSVKELPKNPLKLNPLKGKPWPERWIVGSIWQFHKQGPFRIDLGPSLAYRVSDKIEIGAAYQWRLTVDKKAPVFLSTNEWVSGYSVFADYRIKKGFFFRGSVAHLNMLPEREKVTEEAQSRIWVNSFALGAGKSYTFFRSFKGYTIIQYDFSKGTNKPYKNPLQVKIGFYINGKHFFKKAKEKDSDVAIKD